MPLTKEEIQEIARTSAQTVLEGLHRYAVDYKRPETIAQGLQDSMIEERTAADWYRKREYDAAVVHNDPETATVYGHIALDEDEHYTMLNDRLQGLSSKSGSPWEEGYLGPPGILDPGGWSKNRLMPQTYADWVKLGDDIKARYAEIHNLGGIETVNFNLNTISHEGQLPPVETNEAIANAKRWLVRAAAPYVTRKAKLPTRDDVKVTVWEERDRLHIGIVDKATEQISYADWWDDDARQMFEDGFFKTGIIHHQLSQSADAKMTDSVLEYAEDMGILSK